MTAPLEGALAVCPRCGAGLDDDQPNYCGRCGSDLRPRTPTPDGNAADRAGAASQDAGVPDPLVGRVIDSRYRLLARIGTGGMGAVYRVEHVAMGKIAALKMLHPTLSSHREVVKRFRREAEAVSLLTHPNTVQVFDFGDADGCLYMVMELVRGEDLSAIVRRDGPLPFARAAPLFMQICDALAEAHEAGIVHRDLKPENVLVSRARDGRDVCKVLDFGLAKLRQRDELAVTARGSVIGTPYYMSPEQIRSDEPDARSDVYSLGATMYRVLTGHAPFEGTTPLAVLQQHLAAPVVPLGERCPERRFDPRVEALVARCLAKQPADRFPTVEALRDALQEALADGATLPAPPPPPVERRAGTPSGSRTPVPRLERGDIDRFERRLRRQRALASVTLPLVALVIAGGIWLALRRDGGGAAVDEEVEPNDVPAQANPIASGRTVRGHIGRRSAAEGSDRDFYRFHVDAGPALLRLDLTGIPAMDLRMALFDGGGRRLAETDAGGVGAAEVLPNQRLAAGDYYVEVREVWVAGQPPTEDFVDWYTLTAAWRPLRSDEESEPDDTPADAVALPLGLPVRGYLGRAADVDFFRPLGAGGGSLAGSVTGIEGVDIRVVTLPPGAVVTADDLAHLPARDAEARLPVGARVFDAGGPGAAERFGDVAWPAGAPPPLIAIVRKERAPNVGGQRDPLVGVDVSYAITATLAH